MGLELLRAAVLLLALSPLANNGRLLAQSPAARAVIEASPTLDLTPNVETAFAIRIAAGADLPKRTMLLIQGIPTTLSLTEGRVFDSGVWFVPVADLPKLKIVAASEAAGVRTPLTLTLVSLEGTVLAEGRITLAVNKATGAAPVETMSTAAEVKAPVRDDALATAPPAAKPAPAKHAAPVPATALSPVEEAERLKSGQAALALNDVAAARLVFEYLAKRGSAAGAWHMAQTYDPQVLARRVGTQIKPDEAAAAKWYAKAAEMGHAEARKKVAGNR
jgi:hypothetical protein